MPIVDNAIYVAGHPLERPASLGTTAEELHAASQGQDAFCWIGIFRPDVEEMNTVAREFSLHPLAVKDAVSAHQRPKIEQYGEETFVVLRPARYVDHDEAIELGEIHVFLGPNFVITVRHADEPDLGAVRARLEGDPELLAMGPPAVLYAILDRVVDDIHDGRLTRELRVPQRPVPAGVEGQGLLPVRAGRAQNPLPGHPVPGHQGTEQARGSPGGSRDRELTGPVHGGRPHLEGRGKRPPAVRWPGSASPRHGRSPVPRA